MDYLRWLVTEAILKNDNRQALFPIFALSIVITLGGFAIHIILGIILASILSTIFIIILFAVLSAFYKESYADYLRDKEHEKRMNTERSNRG